MFIANQNTTQTAGSSLRRSVSEPATEVTKASKRRFFNALRLTVAAMLFVVASFVSFGADVSVANAKTAAKGKTTKQVKAKAKATTVKAKATKATKASAIKAKSSKSKALAVKAKKATTATALKASAKSAKKSSKAKQLAARVKNSVKKTATKAKMIASVAAKSTVKTLGGQWGLLNQYKRDLATYGKQKLEGWSEKMEGTASWYGTFFHGRLTASGRRFNKYANIAAHRSLPFGTVLKVTNKDNGKSAIVEVLDRGPYVHDRLIDLSQGTATKLGFMGTGVANVQTEILKVGDLEYKVEAPLTAAELRGDVIRHQIDLAGIDATRTRNRPFIFGAASLEGLLPELKPDMDAFATTNIVDTNQLIALRNEVITIGRA
jgi:rare lipoprotein A (peptidoglycan hydrolase)